MFAVYYPHRHHNTSHVRRSVLNTLMQKKKSPCSPTAARQFSLLLVTLLFSSSHLTLLTCKHGPMHAVYKTTRTQGSPSQHHLTDTQMFSLKACVINNGVSLSNMPLRSYIKCSMFQGECLCFAATSQPRIWPAGLLPQQFLKGFF